MENWRAGPLDMLGKGGGNTGYAQVSEGTSKAAASLAARPLCAPRSLMLPQAKRGLSATGSGSRPVQQTSARVRVLGGKPGERASESAENWRHDHPLHHTSWNAPCSAAGCRCIGKRVLCQIPIGEPKQCVLMR